MTGDKISTADDARAEVQLDFANTIRFAANTKANIANLTKKNIQIQLGEGLATYTVSKDSETEPEIDTPNVSIHPSHHDGVFRIEVHPDGDTIVIVRKGEAQIATPQGSTEVRSGEMATVRGTAESAQYKISSAPIATIGTAGTAIAITLFAMRIPGATRIVTTPAAQDLDTYGQWRHVDDYGDVWYPNEPGDWAPYRNGNWVYQPYYGWTWVGYEPWGWAPYHYGRWLYNGGWGWWPGPVYGGYRPFWAPAYVSFWGWGGGWGFGVGFGGWGGFGWLPLGPCDWYHPWWGGYRGRFGVVNVTNVHVTNVHNYGGIHPLHNGMRFSNLANLHNVHVGRAMSTVNAGRFGAGRVSAVAARPEQLRGARMMAGNLPVVPSRASLSASGRAASSATIRNGGAQRFFGAHNNIARPASFQQQTASLRQTMQQNRVGAIPAGGRSNGEFAGHGPSAVGTMQRPSAGVANRQAGSTGTRNVPNQNSQSGAYRPFSGNNSASRPEPQRGTSQAAPAENRGGFRPFTPPSGNNRPVGGSSSGRDLSRSVEPVRLRPQRTVAGSGLSRRRAETIVRLAAVAARRDLNRSAAPVRPLLRRTVAASGHSILHREVRFRVVERPTAVAATGIGLLPVRAGSSAATQMVTAADHHGRNSICVNRSCVTLRTAGADIHEEAIAHPAMVAPAERRAPRGRVMAVVAPGRHPAMAAVGMLLAAAGVAAGMHPAVEAVAIPAVVAVTPGGGGHSGHH